MIENLKNTVHLGDSLEFMKKLPDKCIDLILTDPPYGIGIDGQKKSININNSKANRKEYEFLGWDNEIPEKEYFDEIFRISKNQIIWGGNYFVKYLNEGHKGWILWDKGQHGLTMSDGELAYTSFDKPLRIYVMNRVYLQLDNPKHPTQKPKELFKWCLENYSNPGDLILDCFGGSGTTAVACIETGRNYILIEKEPTYVEIINKRIKNTTPPLFII